jgi:tetratricopeptide (TPR) repeat protein
MAGVPEDLEPGRPFGPRYEIRRLVGSGGMGAVYEAWDRDLAAPVALKVIRTDLLGSGESSGRARERFKRELVLARQVTHKNVVRIHDLGEVDGVMYLTMPYLEGRDLASVLRDGDTLAVPRALHIARQIAEGLRAAHESGVVHRDLKPANVMLEPGDRATIMDFGIACPLTGEATRTATIIGTPEYMAPEQLVGTADQRTDIFALGRILGEMCGTAAPANVRRVVERCVALDRSARYQSVDELVQDLDVLEHGSGRLHVTRRWFRMPAWAWGIAASLVAAAAVSIPMMRNRGAAPAASAPARPSTLTVVPLANETGDPALDRAGIVVADLIRRALSATRVRIVSGGTTSRLLRDLHLSAALWRDPAGLKPLRDLSAADATVSGAIVRREGVLQIDAALDRGAERIGLPRVVARDAGELLAAAAPAAAAVHNVLENAVDSAWRPPAPPSRSLAALSAYLEASERLDAGQRDAAADKFREAIHADPEFALAHAGLAQCLKALDRVGEARDAAKAAIAASAARPESEKTLIAAIDAEVADADGAVELYARAVAANPADIELRVLLARLLESKGSYDRAASELAAVIEAQPRHLDALYLSGRIAIRRDRVAESLEPLNRALSLAVQLERQTDKARVLQALGIAYKKLGKWQDALRQYEAALAIAHETNDRVRQASSLGEIAQIQEALGDIPAALKSYGESCAMSRVTGNRSGLATCLNNLGSLYLDRGRFTDADRVYRDALVEYRGVADGQGEATALSNLAAIHISLGDLASARTEAERSLDLRERSKVPGALALSLFNLSDVAVQQGDLERAERYIQRAIDAWRESADARGGAIGASQYATVLRARGRLGAAVQWAGRAADGMRALKERGSWWGIVLMQQATALSEAGRFQEAEPVFAEALAAARTIQHPQLIAQILTEQASHALRTGGVSQARAAVAEALQHARGADAPIERLRAAIVRAAAHLDADARGSSRDLASLRAEAARRGMVLLAVQCDLDSATALIASRQAGRARDVLQPAVSASDRTGTRVMTALLEWRLAEALAQLGDAAGAEDHRRRAGSLAAAIAGDGAPQLFARRDFAPLAR